MSEEVQAPAPSSDSSPNPRRKRRRRRRRGGGEDNESASTETNSPRRGRRSRRGTQSADPNTTPSMPSSGKNRRRRRSRRRRGAPVSGIARRRALSRSQVEELEAYFTRLDDSLLELIYKGMGGQPGRIDKKERVVQLTVRAIAQGSRVASMLRACHERERTALAILIQCGGLAHNGGFLRELVLSLGGQDREWEKVMTSLANKGLVFSSAAQDDHFFYMVPEPLVEFLLPHLTAELKVPTFQHEDIQVREQRPFSPPLDFSITTLCTYIDQKPPRLTQQHEIYKTHKEEMDGFFSQLWEAGSDLFHFHIDFLMQHGLVELRGDSISVNRQVVEEWLNIDRQDQRDLIFRALDKSFPYAEWALWAVHSGQGEWVPEQPLSALYRRWKRGEEWRKRLHEGVFVPPRSSERESWSFAPLVRCGMLELGEWGQEKFYRLTPRALAMLEPAEDDGFTAFYLTPSFEIMAPAGLAPQLLFRIGELGELTGCDRANTYRINEINIESALSKGWRRDDILDFLRENSQIGLPENVEQTLRGWMGYQGDVEFHQAVLLSVHNSRIRKLESNPALKPFLLHRFVPGLYAVDPSKMEEITQILNETGFHPSRELKHYPGSPTQVASRDRLLQMVAEARATSEDPLARAQAADTQPEDLHCVPGTGRKRPKRKSSKAPRVSPREARLIANQAITTGADLELLYLGRDGSRVASTVKPQRLAVAPDGNEVMVGRDLKKDELRTYRLTNIERMRAL
ncbi:MAG: helicase-associated domain-containing protein [Myxococcota bacterium]|nr:helicase-associated domain-containing protein [Myxococcota bacterium]